jgi:hypothetical protein
MLAVSGGVWTNASFYALKENIRLLTSQDVMAALAKL